MTTSKISIALVPDRFAHYRLPIFKRLSVEQENNFVLTIYADTEPDIPNIKIVSSEFCNLNICSGGIKWRKIKNIILNKIGIGWLGFRDICFWQTGLLRLALRREHQVIVYWGEAHRISTWLSVILARLSGKRVLFWTHGLYGNENRFKLKIRILFYCLADALLLYGDYSRDLLLKQNFPVSRMFVIKNSLDCQKQEAVYTRLPQLQKVKNKLFPIHDRVLLFIGRLEPAKRLDLLLGAVSILRGRGLPVKALIVGDGLSLPELKLLAAELNITNYIRFYGACYDESKLGPLIAISDVCVSPGNVGLTAMHALVYGTPVITHDNFSRQGPEFEAIQSGISGEFFKSGNVNSLAASVENCLHQIDTGRITSETCRSIIQRYYNTDCQQRVFQKALAAVCPSYQPTL